MQYQHVFIYNTVVLICIQHCCSISGGGCLYVYDQMGGFKREAFAAGGSQCLNMQRLLARKVKQYAAYINAYRNKQISQQYIL